MQNDYNLIFKKNDPIIFWKHFNELKLNFEYIGARYNPLNIDYFFVRALEDGYTIDDHSCIFLFKGIPLNKTFISSTESIATPALPTSPTTLG